MIYSKTHCIFCGEKANRLFEKDINRPGFCHCEHEYFVDDYKSNKYLDRICFTIGEYRFEIGHKLTKIYIFVPPYSLRYEVKGQLTINKDNYLSVVERAKNLQLFN